MSWLIGWFRTHVERKVSVDLLTRIHFSMLRKRYPSNTSVNPPSIPPIDTHDNLSPNSTKSDNSAVSNPNPEG